MSLLPVFVQPPRARQDVPSTPAPKRSAPDAHRNAFSDSFAAALRRPVASLPAVPQADARQEADVRPECGMDATTKSATVPATEPARDPALDPMMDAEAPPTGILAAPIAIPDEQSLPQAMAVAQTPTIADDDVHAPVLIEIRSDGPVYWSPKASAPVAAVPNAPAVVPPVGDEDEAQCAAGEEFPSEADAASVAAAQVIAALPFAPAPLPASPVPEHAPVQHGDEAETVVASFTARSLPATPTPSDELALVEDHFDAAAATLAASSIRTSGTNTPQPDSTSAKVETSPATGTSTGVIAPRAAAVERDLSRLDPAFRERLERVMDRMRQEFGHDVTVVETTRTQSRQNALFAQGRTAPGPVVTWTRNSRHSKGLAADLQVDGAWQNPLGYARLADIAKQEGLRTLGARDPGHVELPTDATVSSETLGALLGDLQGEAGDTARKLRAELTQPRNAETHANRMAQVSNVAQVARVATVASVARVAEVARPGAGRASTSNSEIASALAVAPVVPAAGTTDLAGAMRVATPVTGVNMADRITQLMDLQASQASKPLNSVLLRMENAAGADDQIRIDTRGTAVEARLGLGNAQQAAALTDRLGELREALERRGLTADSVRVQAASGTRTADSATFSRSTAPVLELAAMRAMSDSQAQGNLREQSTRDQQQREAFAREQARHTPRSSSDDPRHRSRREQPEDRR